MERSYKYSFTVLEAACALCDVDVEHVRSAMLATDTKVADQAMKAVLSKCRFCSSQLDCPEWTPMGYEEPATLICPEHFQSVPSEKLEDYLPAPRSVPMEGEAPKVLVDICQLLGDAIAGGELSSTNGLISRTSLKVFWEKLYPDDKPAMFCDLGRETAGDGGKLQIVLGALLHYLKGNKYFKAEDAKRAISEYSLGRGFSTRTLDTLFSEASEAFRNVGKAGEKTPAKTRE